MTREEAAKYAENMTYRDAINNLMKAKSIPYRKATFIKVNELLKVLEQEPYEEIHREKEQAYMQGYEDACKKYRKEPCEDAISRQAVQDYIAKYLSQYLYEDVRQAVETIDTYIGDMSSVNPQETKTGHWIDHQEGRWIYAKCSECGTVHDTRTNYCPNCGAKMEESEETE